MLDQGAPLVPITPAAPSAPTAPPAGVSGVGRPPDRPSWGIVGLPFLAKGGVGWPEGRIGGIGTRPRRALVSGGFGMGGRPRVYVSER